VRHRLEVRYRRALNHVRYRLQDGGRGAALRGFSVLLLSHT